MKLMPMPKRRITGAERVAIIRINQARNDLARSVRNLNEAERFLKFIRRAIRAKTKSRTK